jgi:HAE1 family hydrophobic/amphiphilic exporter-1
MMLPEEAQDVSILKLDINSLPIITIGVSGERSLEDINKIVEDTIAPRLERIDGVASVNVSGGQEQQVQITVDPHKLNVYGLTTNTASTPSSSAARLRAQAWAVSLEPVPAMILQLFPA